MIKLYVLMVKIDSANIKFNEDRVVITNPINHIEPSILRTIIDM
jgi:hypothetical protein